MEIRNCYSLCETLKNIKSFIYTKLFYKNARLIRTPIFVRGKCYLEYGKGLTTGYNCRLEMFNIGKGKYRKIKLGKNCKIGDYVHIASAEQISIGDNVLIGSKVLITDLNHGNYSGRCVDSMPNIPPDKRPLHTKSVLIGDNVWIGDNVCILPGVKIGNGCIVGANSVVNINIPENCIVAGIPAKIIKVYNHEKDEWIKV